jgi:adenylate cyclase
MAQTEGEQSQQTGPRVGRWSFGNAILDERSLELTVGGRPVALERKSLEVLMVLLRRAGDVVTKDDLLAAVWPGRVLSETVLTKCISRIREALGDDEQKIIKTLHGYGYRLAVPVKLETGAAAPVVAGDAAAPAEAPVRGRTPRTRRQLTAVMLTDIAGYSALVNADERRGHELLEMHRKVVRRQVSAYGGTEIETTGDGFLIIFDSALAAVECAVSIQQAMLQRNATVPPAEQLRLRIGIHQGDVERGRGTVFGDGVNVCARIEPLSPIGGVAVTSLVAAQIHGPMRDGFRSAGLQALKNIRDPIEVLCLEEAGLRAAARFLEPPGITRRYFRRAVLAAAGAAAALAATGAVLLLTGEPEPAPGARIAVLPLDNLSSEANSTEFAAGLHDSLLTELSKMPQLRVISRSSVLRFAKERPSAPELGELLKVGHVLEGSVQRQGSRIRLNVRLILTATDDHVWAQDYDRDVEDLFDVQTDIAREVTRRIYGHLLVSALPRSLRPTHSVEAYDLYLRGIASEASDPSIGRRAHEPEIELLRAAVTLDPDFALAHAALARYCIWGANWAGNFSPDKVGTYVQSGLQAAQAAMALAPEQPESLLAMGLARYWDEKDAAVGAEFFERALARRPGFPLGLFWLSVAYRDLSELDKSVAATRLLLELDPHNEQALAQLGGYLERMRRYPEADEAYARWGRVSTTPAYAEAWRSQLHFHRTGDLGPFKKFLERQGQRNEGITESDLNYWNWLVAMCEGRYGDAAQVFMAQADAQIGDRGPVTEDPLLAAWAMKLAGRGDDRAERYAHALIEHFGARVAQDSADRYAYSILGRAQALLGDAGSALKNTRTAMTLSVPPPGRGPSQTHFQYVQEYARIAAYFGQKQEALERLEWLLQQPSGVHAHLVLRDPLWLPLSREPEFQNLVRKYLPETVQRAAR